ncbi:MAG: hypothetical protein J6W02_08170, partial [Bacteroidaceae bacterium]|nr:hypothetical protein [Bacteroidaceae bacterium]
KIKGNVQFNWRRKLARLKESTSTIEGKHEQREKRGVKRKVSNFLTIFAVFIFFNYERKCYTIEML